MYIINMNVYIAQGFSACFHHPGKSLYSWEGISEAHF